MQKIEANVTRIFNDEDFRYFAIRQHGTQMYGDLPYAYHLAQLESTLNYYGFDEYSYRAGAWLHDIVEDTPTPYDKVCRLYGPEVTSIVWACTGEGNNRAERNASIYRKLKEFPKAAPVKVADRLCNVCHGGSTNNIEKIKMYVSEFAEFKANVEPLMTSSRDRALWAHLEDTNEHLVGVLANVAASAANGSENQQ